MRTIWWLFLLVFYISATVFFHPEVGFTQDNTGDSGESPMVDASDELEADKEDESNPEPPAKDEKDADLDNRSESDEAVTVTEPQEASDGVSTLGFREPIGDKHSWYRDSGEWIAARTTRDGLTMEPVTKVLTDGKRFDLSFGKRIAVHTWGEESMTKSWSAGFDGGMAITMFRGREETDVTFATENFDGFFGAYLARALHNTIYMVRVAHVSSHLVDNNPAVLSAIPYSRFWMEFIVGKTFPDVGTSSRWNLHLQASIGLNFKSEPAKDSIRYLAGFDLGYSLFGTDSLSVITSFDLRQTGVAGQKTYYAAFLGLGRLKRPETTNRPWRFGISHHWGSDYRNQYFRNTDEFTSFELQLEF